MKNRCSGGDVGGHGVTLILLLMHFVAPLWFLCCHAGGVVEAKVLKIHGELACSTRCCNLGSGSAENDACRGQGGTAGSLQSLRGSQYWSLPETARRAGQSFVG